MVDATQLEFSSNWDIDQINPPVTISVGGGDTQIATFTGDAPVFEVVAKPSGWGGWVQPGVNGIFGGPEFTLNAYISGNAIRVITNKACSIRCYIWSDKVAY